MSPAAPTCRQPKLAAARRPARPSAAHVTGDEQAEDHQGRSGACPAADHFHRVGTALDAGTDAHVDPRDGDRDEQPDRDDQPARPH